MLQSEEDPTGVTEEGRILKMVQDFLKNFGPISYAQEILANSQGSHEGFSRALYPDSSFGGLRR